MASLPDPATYLAYDTNSISDILEAFGVNPLMFDELKLAIALTIDNLTSKHKDSKGEQRFKQLVEEFKRNVPLFKPGIEQAQVHNPAWFNRAMTYFLEQCSHSVAQNRPTSANKQKRRREQSPDVQQDELSVGRKTAHGLAKRPRQGSLHGRIEQESVEPDSGYVERGLSVLMNEAHITPVPNHTPLRLKVWIQGRPVQAFVDANAIEDQLGQYCPAKLLSYLTRTKPEQFPPTSSWTLGISDPKESGPTAWWFKIEDTEDFDYTIRSHAEGCQYPNISITLIEEEIKLDSPRFSNNNGGDNSNDDLNCESPSNGDIIPYTSTPGVRAVEADCLHGGDDNDRPIESNSRDSRPLSRPGIADYPRIDQLLGPQPGEDDEGREARADEIFRLLLYHGTSLSSVIARVDLRIVNLVNAYLPQVDREALLQTHRISLPDLGLNPSFKAYPFQIFGAVLAFHRIVATDVPGIILSDAPGTGKTITALLLHALRNHRARNIADIEECRANHDDRHLRPDAAKDLPCPSASTQPISCTCTYLGRTTLYPNEFVTGISMALTSSYHLSSLLRDFPKVFDNSTSEGDQGWLPRLAVHHFGQFDAPLSNVELSRTSRTLEDLTKFRLERAQISAERIDGLVQYTPFDFKSKGPEILPPDRKRDLMAARYLVVTTAQSFNRQVWEKYKVERLMVWKDKKSGQTRQLSFKDNALQVGLLFNDEFDYAPKATVYQDFISKMKEQCRQRFEQVPAFVPITSTPDPQIPLAVVRQFVNVLHNPKWDSIPTENAFHLPELHGLQGVDISTLDQIINKHNELREAMRKDPKSAIMLPKFGDLCKVIFAIGFGCVITRTYDTKWFDGKFAIPKRHKLSMQEWTVYWTSNNVDFMNGLYHEGQRVQEARERNSRLTGKDPPKPSSNAIYYNARVAAVLPTLVRYWSKTLGHGITSPCSARAPDIQEWVQNPHSAEFRDVLHISDVTRTGKVKWVLNKCRELEKKCANNRNPGRRIKVVIASGIPIVRATLCAVLGHSFGNEALSVIDGGQDDDQMNVIMDEWNNKEDIWIMVSHPGTAHKMQRASCVIIMEPTYRLSERQSLVAQFDRTGQIADQISVFVLVSEGSALEGSMRNCNHLQANLRQSFEEYTASYLIKDQVGGKESPKDLLSDED